MALPCKHRKQGRRQVQQMSKVIWQNAPSLYCHPSRRQMHSSAVCAGQAHSPAAAGEQCTVQLCVGAMGQHMSHSKMPILWILSNKRFHVLTTVRSRNGILIGLTVCAQLTHVPNTETDTQPTLHAISVAIGFKLLCHIERCVIELWLL